MGRINFPSKLTPNPQLFFFIHFLIASCTAIAAIIYMLALPTDPKNSQILGYSANRLSIIGLLALASLLSATLALGSLKYRWLVEKMIIHLNTQNKWFFLSAFTLLFFIIGWTLSWTPSDQFHPYHLIFERVHPLIIWMTLFCGQSFLLITMGIRGISFSNFEDSEGVTRQTLKFSLIALGTILLIWVLITSTRLGITADTQFWNDIGIPILPIQVIFSWSVGIVVLLIETNYNFQNNRYNRSLVSTLWAKYKLDILLCMILWAFTSLLWILEPQVSNFFSPGPYPPNDEFYPLSDAAEYDMHAQFALIGQGLFNGNHVDKPLYATFLTLIHWLAGNNFSHVLTLQNIILALLAVLIYFIGRSIHSKTAGFMAGLLVAFKGKNAIASAWIILSANPKILTTEYPLALMLALYTFAIILCCKYWKSKLHLFIFVGGILGLSSLIRNNVWILIPFFLMTLWVILDKKFLKMLVPLLLFSTGLLASTLPWMWRSYQIWKDPFYFMVGVRTVILDQRYNFSLPLERLISNLVNNTPGQPVQGHHFGQDDHDFDPDEIIYPKVWPIPEYVTGGVYDNTHPAIRYDGDWFNFRDEKSYNQTFQFSSVIGNAIHLKFYGQRMKIIYKSAPFHGKSVIKLDGTTIHTLDQFSQVENWQQEWQSPELTNELHELSIQHTEGAIVSFDAILIEGLKYGYRISNECPGSVIYRWIDANIKLSQEPLNGFIPVNIPFVFNYNNSPVDRVFINQQGYIAFSPPEKQQFNPDDEDTIIIAPYWDKDLIPGESGQIFFDSFGTPPGRIFVIEWRDFTLSRTGEKISFEVALFESLNNILFQYRQVPVQNHNAHIFVKFPKKDETLSRFETIPVEGLTSQAVLISSPARSCPDCFRLTTEISPPNSGLIINRIQPNCGNGYVDKTKLALYAISGQTEIQWAENAIASSTAIGYSLATGVADVEGCSDSYNNWIPSSNSEEPEWLELFYKIPVKASGISIHETHLGGFITRIDFIDTAGKMHMVWQGTETTVCGEWFNPPLVLDGPETEYLVQKVKITTKKYGQEGIDAVKLISIGQNGNKFTAWSTGESHPDYSFAITKNTHITANFSPTNSLPLSKETTLLSETMINEGENTQEQFQDSVVTNESESGKARFLFIPAHLLHNWVTTILMLPVTTVNDDIKTTLQGEASIWSADWDNQLSSSQSVIFIFNLIMVSIGLGASYAKWKHAGLAPMITYLAYTLGTALARTSGGRYIVPVDWVPFLYYAIGLAELTIWFASLINLKARPSSNYYPEISEHFRKWKITASVVLLLSLGASPLWADYGFPRRYPMQEKEELFYNLVAKGSINGLGFNNKEIAEFIKQDNSFIWLGRALYPRYYHANQGEPAKGAYRIMDYPRLVFTMIGPNTPKSDSAILPYTDFPAYFPHASDVYVIGCQESLPNTLAVILPGIKEVSYIRKPAAPLICPLQKPICDGDKCQ